MADLPSREIAMPGNDQPREAPWYSSDIYGRNIFDAARTLLFPDAATTLPMLPREEQEVKSEPELQIQVLAESQAQEKEEEKRAKEEELVEEDEDDIAQNFFVMLKVVKRNGSVAGRAFMRGVLFHFDLNQRNWQHRHPGLPAPAPLLREPPPPSCFSAFRRLPFELRLCVYDAMYATNRRAIVLANYERHYVDDHISLHANYRAKLPPCFFFWREARRAAFGAYRGMFARHAPWGCPGVFLTFRPDDPYCPLPGGPDALLRQMVQDYPELQREVQKAEPAEDPLTFSLDLASRLRMGSPRAEINQQHFELCKDSLVRFYRDYVHSYPERAYQSATLEAWLRAQHDGGGHAAMPAIFPGRRPPAQVPDKIIGKEWDTRVLPPGPTTAVLTRAGLQDTQFGHEELTPQLDLFNRLRLQSLLYFGDYQYVNPEVDIVFIEPCHKQHRCWWGLRNQFLQSDREAVKSLGVLVPQRGLESLAIWDTLTFAFPNVEDLYYVLNGDEVFGRTKAADDFLTHEDRGEDFEDGDDQTDTQSDTASSSSEEEDDGDGEDSMDWQSDATSATSLSDGEIPEGLATPDLMNAPDVLVGNYSGNNHHLHGGLGAWALAGPQGPPVHHGEEVVLDQQAAVDDLLNNSGQGGGALPLLLDHPAEQILDAQHHVNLHHAAHSNAGRPQEWAVLRVDMARGPFCGDFASEGWHDGRRLCFGQRTIDVAANGAAFRRWKARETRGRVGGRARKLARLHYCRVVPRLRLTPGLPVHSQYNFFYHDGQAVYGPADVIVG